MQSLDLALRVDVTDDEAVRGGYDEVAKRFGRIDVLFNNAGISPERDGSGIEFAARGIRVNALCPGPVRTRMLDELHARDSALRERRFTYLPARRFAEVDEIANAVLFLASDESSYVNATAFIVDGGAAAAYLSVADQAAAAT
jgi:NAD(P)-dependent dehydrogenase (short-subunit alcohol dehydrogenase family)